jgi:hypothetical protein
MKKVDLVGRRYHRLVVLEKAEPIIGSTGRKNSAWKCQCDCGKIKIVKMDHLRAGHTKSCGCWNDEQRSARAERMYSKVIKYTPREASARRIWKGNYEEMPFEDFYELSQLNCFYCERPPSNCQNAAVGRNSSQNMKDNGYFTYNGLDRIDNTLPHTKENCVPCCFACNYSKRDKTIKDFRQWIIQVYHHWAKKEE